MASPVAQVHPEPARLRRAPKRPNYGPEAFPKPHRASPRRPPLRLSAYVAAADCRGLPLILGFSLTLCACHPEPARAFCERCEGSAFSRRLALSSRPEQAAFLLRTVSVRGLRSGGPPGKIQPLRQTGTTTRLMFA